MAWTRTDDGNPMWRAVVERDRTADGAFVYGVRSTHIYCRPSCPSRRPRPDRVTFYPTPEAAEAVGYRACRRCHPRRVAGPTEGRLSRVCRAVGADPERAWNGTMLARVGQCTGAQLRRDFRAVLGLTPREYVAAVRRRAFLDGLRRGKTVTDAGVAAGFGSFSRAYDGLVLPGMTPATYGRGGEGAAIEWTTVDAPVGTILVAATRRGLCFVEVGPSIRAGLAALKAEFPRATIARRRSVRLADHARVALAAAEARPLPGTLPVDVRATAFQWRVWRALVRIPRGQTRSYAQVAQAIGAPTSARAVARACATNPLALVVPCHRVVGSDGALRGYRWGLAVKKRLLEGERRK